MIEKMLTELGVAKSAALLAATPLLYVIEMILLLHLALPLIAAGIFAQAWSGLQLPRASVSSALKARRVACAFSEPITTTQGLVMARARLSSWITATPVQVRYR